MKYRIAYKISDIKYIDKEIYTNFDDALTAYKWKEARGTFAWIEQKVGKKWQEMTYLEREKAKLTYNEIKEVKIPTSTATYKFKLPKPVKVPNNLNSINAVLYITLKSLGIEPEIEEKKEDGLY